MSILVRNDNGITQLEWDEFEEHVRSGRVSPEDRLQFAPVTGVEWARAGDLELFTSLFDENALTWRRNLLSGSPPIFTALLVGIQVRVWWAAQVPTAGAWLTTYTSKWTPSILEDGAVWRLLTMGWLHTDTFHLLMNMLWLGYTGWNLEKALGWRNVAMLFNLSVLGGSLASVFASPDRPSLGASGGIFGLIAASVVFGLTRPELLPERGRRLFGLALLPYLLIMFLSGLSNESTDNWAHFGGLATGALLTFALDPELLQRRPRWNRTVRAIITGGAALVMLVLGFWGAAISPMPRTHGEEVIFRVPLGWTEKGGVWSAPVSDRTWAVREMALDLRTTPDALADNWLRDMVRAHPEALEIGREPSVLAQRQVLSIRLETEDRVWIWTGETRGRDALETVWSYPQGSAQEVLERRLRDGVVWPKPSALLLAESRYQRSPEALFSKIDLAVQRTLAGEDELAMPLWQGLISHGTPPVWLALLPVVADLPAIHRSALWEAILADDPSPEVIAALARHLDDEGRNDLALGVLEIAWRLRPGDRDLRGARRSRALSLRLDQGQPWESTHDPITGAPKLISPSIPLSIEAAATTGVEILLARDAAVSELLGIQPDDPAAERWVYFLRQGAPPETPDPEALARDIRRIQQGNPPSWCPELLAERWRHAVE